MKVVTKEIDIRYAETDAMQIVYHANYIIWFEIGRTALIKELGLSYADMEKEGYLSPVLDVECHYKKPTKYGEKAFVKTWIEEYTGVKTVYGYEVVNEKGELCVHGKTSHTVCNAKNFRPISMRKVFPHWDEVYRKSTGR